MPRRFIQLCIMLLSTTTLASNMSTHSRPVVLELFTSQGCSSCPPADALIGEIANRPDVIALAYHVDYWDYLGWRDPFGLPINAQRQREYVRLLKLNSAFTPQLIINGSQSIVGSDRRGLNNILSQHHAGILVTGTRTQDRLQLSLPDSNLSGDFNIVAVAYQSTAATTVPRGENTGRVLREHQIVTAINSAIVWNGKHRDVEIPLSFVPPNSTHVAVLVQERNQGAIVGATKITL